MPDHAPGASEERELLALLEPPFPLVVDLVGTALRIVEKEASHGSARVLAPFDEWPAAR
jgi:hypothetical protein